MSQIEKTYQRVCDFARETQLLTSINALLEWDQQTNLPQSAGGYRAEQVTYIASQIHKRQTDSQFGQWLSELSDSELALDLHTDAGSTIRELKHRFEKKRRLPVELIERQAKAFSLAQNVWVDARKNNDFAQFAPHLKEIFELKREEAQAIDGPGSLYDVLLDDFEPGASTEEVGQVLAALKAQIVPLISAVSESPIRVQTELLHRNFPKHEQKKFAVNATKAIGFDYQRGRIDIAHHPFCTELGPDDCRITNRYDESFFNPGFFGALHEAGHGLYEQGLRSQCYGIPPGNYCSLGLHESQSRLWENLVGRSQGFWNHFYPAAQKHFVDALDEVPQNDFYRAINQVKPSLIRVEADEATYDLHIIIRFELEQALLEGELAVDDLPGAWNDKYLEYLGICPTNDREGVLQDIHWSAGLVGYFPTYSIGNIYAAQLFSQANQVIGDLDEQFAAGEFRPLLKWLRSHVHSAGNRFRAGELMAELTNSSLDQRPMVDHLRKKLSLIYQI